MLFSKQEYSLTDKPISQQITSKVQDFLTDNEQILYTFDGDEVVAFFTNTKIIFIYRQTEKYYEAEILPYKRVNRCIVLWSTADKYGKLELVLPDEKIISFYLPEYDDAVSLCNTVLS